jgi:hypothetical protein
VKAGRLLLLLAALALTGCERLPTGPVTGPGPPVRGITFVDWSANGYAAAAADTALEALAATGANTVAIVVTAYQADANAATVRANDPRTPTRSAVRQCAFNAAVRGLRPVLKLHVDLDDGRWRGHIDPPDAAAWFASYRAFVVSWAGLADSLGAADLVIGTELAGTLSHEGEWRATIAAARRVFHGRLVYAASWDEAGRVGFWDALDRVGIDFYFPVTSRDDPGRLEILAGWQPWIERLRVLHQQTGRPILLTEIGYRSVDGAGQAPHDAGLGGTIDVGEQADLYWAALEAIRHESWITGLYWWNWPADGSGGPANADYTPARKPAALELTAAWGGSG